MPHSSKSVVEAYYLWIVFEFVGLPGAGILWIRLLRTNFSEIFIEVYTFSFKEKFNRKCRLENDGHFISASMCEGLCARIGVCLICFLMVVFIHSRQICFTYTVPII